MDHELSVDMNIITGTFMLLQNVVGINLLPVVLEGIKYTTVNNRR